MKCIFCDKEQESETCFSIGNKQICDACLNRLNEVLRIIKVNNELRNK